MRGAAIVAYGAVSGLGRGDRAIRSSEVGGGARVVIARDHELETAGLTRPYASRAPVQGEGDRATLLLVDALRSCAKRLDRLRPGWRGRRVGLVMGTSSGGMRSAELWFGGKSSSTDMTYFAPFTRAAEVLGIDYSPFSLILGACASATFAIGLATRELELDRCDLVLAGGFDAVSVFVASGFEVLGATSATIPPRPFRASRDGMALGEGAAVLALERNAGQSARAFITGFAASSDAAHLTAPDRNGAGLATAIRGALADAQLKPAEIDLVSAHGTATPFNDAAESKALSGVGVACAVEPMKAVIGHTLGAAGGLELLSAISGMHRGVIPAVAGEGERAIEAEGLRLPAVAERARIRNVLKLSSAFGGANAAIIASRIPSTAKVLSRPVYVSRGFHAADAMSLEALADALGQPIDKLARADLLTRLCLEAVNKLSQAVGKLSGSTGIVVGHSLATMETNARYQARITSRGARLAEPRRFPYTSPNASAGECALAFGLKGPSFAVGAGLHGAVEALVTAITLVRSGDAERVVVVGADEIDESGRRWLHESGLPSDLSRSGAVALLVTRDVAWGSVSEARTMSRSSGPNAWGHQALLPLVDRELPLSIESSSTDRGAARVRLEVPG